MVLLFLILCSVLGSLLLLGLFFVCLASGIGSGLGMAESLIFFIPAYFVWRLLRRMQRQ